MTQLETPRLRLLALSEAQLQAIDNDPDLLNVVFARNHSAICF